MTLKEYMSQTEFAVKQLFDSIAHYDSILKEAVLPSFTYSGSNDIDYKKKEEEFFNDPKIKLANKYANKKLNEYLGLKYSRSVICGSIFQIACMIIDKVSNNDIEFEFVTKNNKQAIKYCIGRKVRKLPIGLIIYAARNQYSHWTKELYSVNKQIFDYIAKREIEFEGKLEIWKDPSFNLELDYFDVHTDQLFSLIGWNSYSRYKSDMLNMLSKYEEE